MAFKLDPKLREYATDCQWQKLKALEKHGSERAAAQALGCHRKCFHKAKKSIEKKAALKGYAPEYDLVHPVAPGMTSRGTSIKYDGAGEIMEYWNKTTREGMEPEDERVAKLPDPKTITKISTQTGPDGKVMSQWVAEKPEAVAQMNAWAEYAKALAEPLPRIKPTAGPKTTEATEDDLMVCYPVGDHHLGMLAWDKETGDDYDMKIAENLLTSAFDHLALAAPPATYGAVIFLGDFLHYDSFEPVTPTSRNQLDADSRYPKMVRTGVRCMRYAIERALTRHEYVRVIVEIGNHDLSSSIFLMECLSNIYDQEPRVTIDTSPMHYHYFTFGKCLIGTHHGHGTNMKNLPMIMAADRPEDWGKTKYRYWWTGHIHTSKTQAAVSSQDLTGCTVESFRVLAAPDAWAHQNGYRPHRDMKSIILHRDYGEVARNTVNPEMFA